MASHQQFISHAPRKQTQHTLLALVAAVALSAPAFAATYNFIPGAGTTPPASVNGSSGDWADGANWATGTTAGTVPGSADQASSSSGATVNVTTTVPTINELRFANNAAGAALNTVSGNAYTSNATAYLTIASTGVLNIASTNGNTNGSCTIGNSNGNTGTLTINGGTLTTGGTTQTTEVAGGLESLVIGGTASSATAAGPIGNFFMNSGTVTVANNFINGYGATVGTTSLGYAAGTTTQSGGTINVAGSVIVGAKGHGTYIMTGGSLIQTGTNATGNALGRDAFYLGQSDTTTAGNAQGGQGSFNQSGSAVVSISNGLYIANQSNTTGLYTLSGGTLTIAGDMSVGAAFGAGVFAAALPVTAAVNNTGRFQINGNSAATITANHMTANTANSTLGFGIASSAGTTLIDLTAGDSLDGSAQLSTSTLVDLDPMSGFTPAPGDVYTLLTATSISALPTLTLDGDAFDNSALSIITNTDGSQSLIDTLNGGVLPEPASLSLLALAASIFTRRRRA